jgi:hypothetical protein
MKRAVVSCLILVLFLPLAVGIGLRAQEMPEVIFGPRDVLPLFFRSLTVADLIILEDGSVLSATVLTSEFILSSAKGTQTLNRDDLIAIIFESGVRDALDTLFLKAGEKLTGKLEFTEIEAELVLTDKISLNFEPDEIRAIIFRLPPEEELRRNPAIFFRQLFGFFNPLLVSVTKFDTLVFLDGRVASVSFENRDELAFTIDSPVFGTFTFSAPQIAWVLFGRSPDQPDQLVLKNGDRVSGTVTAQQDLRGTLASGGMEILLLKDQLREQVKQILFKIPVRLFGGGGPPERITPRRD